MSDLKQAWSIVLLELKLNKLGHLVMVFSGVIYLIFTILMLKRVDSFLLVDLFLIFFVSLPIVMRGKYYTGQKVENELYASRFVMMLSQLPISKKVLLKNRVLVSLLFNVCLNILYLTVLCFVVHPVHAQLSGVSALVFILFWLCFGYQTGALIPASEIGATYSRTKLTVYSVLLYGFIACLLFVFHAHFNISIYEWSIYLAVEHTLISLLILLIIMVGTYFYGLYEGKKAIHRVDYYL